MPMDDLGISEIAAKSVGAGLLGLVGRAVHIAASANRPVGWQAISVTVLWEIPIGLGMGVIGWGLADYIGLKGFPHYAMVVSVAIAGPKLISVLLDLAIQRVTGGKSLLLDAAAKPAADSSQPKPPAPKP